MPRAKPKRGRKPDASSKSGRIRELLKTGMSANDIAKKVGCTTGLVYNVKARAGGASKGARQAGRPARRAGRPSRVATQGDNGLAGILAAVQGTERERTQLRAVLEKLRSVIADALA